MSKNPEQTAGDSGQSEYGHLVDWFRQATPYINAHRGKTFVVMLGGDAVAHDNIRNIIHDLVLLHSLGIRIVIIHGVRQQLDEKLAQAGIDSTFVSGLRVTSRAVLQAAIEASSLVRAQLETSLSMGLPNSPMHGAKVRVASANAITAKPAGIIDGTDLQHTGLVRKIDTVSVNTLLEMGNVVLLSPIGYSPAGEAFSLSCEQVASEIAISLDADKLIAFSATDGVSDASGQLLRELTTAEIRQQALNHNNACSCIGTALNAVEGGVPRAHIMNFATDGALLQELFTVDGAGTLVLNSNFEITRQASSDDIPAIIDIITPLEEKGVLVKRDREKLEEEIGHFTVIEREGLIISLAALYPYKEDGVGEIACIATHPDYRNSSRGAQLLACLEDNARDAGLSMVFVLTTQTTHWFIENGFSAGSFDDLPAKKQSLYNYQRNSQVLAKKL